MNTVLTRSMLLSAFVFACGFVSPVSTDSPLALLPDEHLARDGVFLCKVGNLFVRTELFFGRNKTDGEVTDEEFQRFLKRKITPRFPEGLTVLMGQGQFRNANRDIVQENSVLLILLYPAEEGFRHRRIERIRQDYKDEFGQESVLRVDTTACVSF